MPHFVMSEDSPFEVMHCMEETGCSKLGSSADAMLVLPQLCQLQSLGVQLLGLGAHTTRRQRRLSMASSTEDQDPIESWSIPACLLPF